MDPDTTPHCDERGACRSFDAGIRQLAQWDPEWAGAAAKMATDSSLSTTLSHKTIALTGIALSAACTNLDPNGTRRHIRAALGAGASRDEILTVLKMASLLAIHSCSLGAPILLDEAEAADMSLPERPEPLPSTPACDKLRQLGQWNEAWNPFFDLDPVWTDQFMAAGLGIYASGVMEPKLLELLSIAFDVSYTHMYAPGTRRHIRAALALGATVEEIMDVLKLCVAHGLGACGLGAHILAEELAEERIPSQKLPSG